jgi:alkylhydroperoxidase/carboxymuconolactone decarboxylase family protein YurZ
MSKGSDSAAVDRYRDVLARHDPETCAALDRVPETVYRSARSLDARTKELVMIVMHTVLKAPDAVLRHHVRRAIELGASKQAVLEAIELVITPAGMPAFEHGLMAWADALGETGLEVEGAVYSKLPGT